jgi:hypothetical protein
MEGDSRKAIPFTFSKLYAAQSSLKKSKSISRLLTIGKCFCFAENSSVPQDASLHPHNLNEGGCRL